MKKLFLFALCSMPLLSVARAEESKMSSGDSTQHGVALKGGDDRDQGGRTVAPDSTKTSGSGDYVTREEFMKLYEAIVRRLDADTQREPPKFTDAG